MKNKRLAQIERRIEKIKAELAEIGEMRPGSLTRQYKDPESAVFVNKDVRSIIQAAFGSYDRSACNSFGGFSQTSETGSQFRVLPDQRAGLRFFAAS